MRKGSFEIFTDVRESDGILLPVASKFTYVENGYTTFPNETISLQSLNGGEANLLDYYCNKMSRGNVIMTGKIYRGMYSKHMESLFGKELKDSTIKSSIGGLIKKNLLAKIEVGQFMVNPHIFVRSTLSKKSRIVLLKRWTILKGEAKSANPETLRLIIDTDKLEDEDEQND